MSVPNFGDIAKSANDLLNKDFYHLSATTFELKSNTPNNVAFKVTGKTSHEKTTAGAIEGKYSDKATGLTLTQTWNTAAALDTKVELADSLAKGLKAEGVFSFLPSAGEKAASKKGAKFNLTFKQSNFHSRAFFDLLKGPTAHIDAVVGHEGFLAGASAGYDVQKASVTGYAAAVGYQAPTYSAAITASDNLSLFAASYYHKVNSQVEAGAKATWNSKAGNNVGLEVASKYRIDPVSFAKVCDIPVPLLQNTLEECLLTSMSLQFKVNNNGVAALGYNVLLREGVTLGLGASFDTQKLDQATHKLGASFTFEG
ncbi:Mitochondrial outer membrane protein porin [Colletotrichum shisoi]|uniref:Mitochondrial outer membrane protein porin n=1 Tax=Colletotrichum shisoi TaxID=2078593 RepID=A0A5Q4BYD4_9PEZI|nr:Mitochondrial outer membrane protein porin [Colletotrichum shisoi]